MEFPFLFCYTDRVFAPILSFRRTMWSKFYGLHKFFFKGPVPPRHHFTARNNYTHVITKVTTRRVAPRRLSLTIFRLVTQTNDPSCEFGHRIDNVGLCWGKRLEKLTVTHRELLKLLWGW